ncbi:hypothetical protein NLX86_18875 [Streptomyces sp. A3M-1-3]|uniref:hypothetical protein n=1 Tax=Streptomyces sp. A3M-1-3 TaxID=2962044 RepID=UPI0020B8BB02|nr:hypothetical protein [Streptomyces sp. A3M-1-3]MCP3820082.1 hypothetical protein [Streptomyces sp. A3M-1-3]
MAVRFGVMAATEQECAEALALLCATLGARVVQQPAQLAGERWIARAVPTPAAPVREDRGREG